MNIKNNKEEDMHHPPPYLLLTAAAGRILPASASSEAMPDDAPAAVVVATAAEIKVAITGRIGLTVDRGRKVFIEFLASLKLAAAVRTSLTSSDFELADTREQANMVHELDGVFQALYPATRRTAEVRAGGYAENPAPSATKSGRGDSVMLLLNPLTMLIGTIVSNAGNATGVRNSANAVAAGNPDSKRLSCCETRRYRQYNIVNLTCKEDSTEQRCSVLATAEDAELVSA